MGDAHKKILKKWLAIGDKWEMDQIWMRFKCWKVLTSNVYECLELYDTKKCLKMEHWVLIQLCVWISDISDYSVYIMIILSQLSILLTFLIVYLSEFKELLFRVKKLSRHKLFIETLFSTKIYLKILFSIVFFNK